MVLASLFGMALAAHGPHAQAAGDAAWGLPYAFFHDASLTRLAAQGVDDQVNIELTGYHDCSRLWLGNITFPVTGQVRLEAEAAQGLRLHLGGKLVLDGWAPDGVREATVMATAGQPVPLRLEWYHLGGQAVMRLFWSWEGHPRELVPPSAFTHSSDDLHQVALFVSGRHSAPMGDEAIRAQVYRPGQPGALPVPLRLGPGPHLFLDDLLIEASTNLTRRVNRPQRDPDIPNPIITGKEDRCFQPYLTVVRDANTGRFRMWYGCYGEESAPAVSHIAYTESNDGIHWERPIRVLKDPGPIQFGSSVIDEGPDFPDPSVRYKLAWWRDGGLKLATSPDGLSWTMLVPWVVLAHNHDINNVFRDRLRNRYVAILSVYTTGPTWSGERRVTMMSVSDDLLNWAKPWLIITPQDGLDPGETQFYAMSGHLIRGGLWIGLVKVLRDDLQAPGAPQGAYGMGYTTLAWSHDGESWVRDQEPFFEPDPDPQAWDHAHAWVDCQLPVGDGVYLYYGGYKSGHKWNRFEERQIGLVRMRRDRYVARETGRTQGVLRTPLVILDAESMTVNATVFGELRVRILDAAGAAISGFDFSDCAPVRGDAVDQRVTWARELAAVRGSAVRLEFRLRDAALYGFDLQ